MMQPKSTFFLLSGLSLSLVTPAVAKGFYVYTGQENWWTPDTQVVAQSCWLFKDHPSCDDVTNTIGHILNDDGGDLSGDGRGCLCEGPGDACTHAPHKIERFEVHTEEDVHFSKTFQEIHQQYMSIH